MLSYNALKYSVVVHRSVYAGLVVTGLYATLILLVLRIFNVSWLTSPLLIFLLIIAAYGGKKSYAQTYLLKLSDAGDIDVICANGDLIHAEISPSSFYNGLFLSLHLQSKCSVSANLTSSLKSSLSSIVIYKDAVSEEEYRLLARLIHLR